MEALKVISSWSGGKDSCLACYEAMKRGYKVEYLLNFICGENGEFHTFVIDGPIFKKKIDITKSCAILKEGFWKHWFLDIQEYKMG